MTKLFAAFLLLAAMPAHADLYSERQAEFNRRASANRESQEASQAAAQYGQQTRAFYAFLARLGGAAEGSCSIRNFGCQYGRCGETDSLARVPVYGLGGGAFYFAGCTVTLNDGQACVINRYLSTITWNYEGFHAYCYDANSVRREYFSSGRGAAKKPLRKKR